MDASKRRLRQDDHSGDERRVGQQIENVAGCWVGNRIEVLVVECVNEVADRVQRDHRRHGEPCRLKLGCPAHTQQHRNERQCLSDRVDPSVPDRVVPARRPVHDEGGHAVGDHEGEDEALQTPFR